MSDRQPWSRSQTDEVERPTPKASPRDRWPAYPDEGRPIPTRSETPVNGDPSDRRDAADGDGGRLEMTVAMLRQTTALLRELRRRIESELCDAGSQGMQNDE